VYENRVPLNPCVSHWEMGLKARELPVAKIARDDAKRVFPRKEWGNNFPEPNLRLTIYRTDEDGNNGYVQPGGILSLWPHPKSPVPHPSNTLRT
jgi:hypothetical protein